MYKEWLIVCKEAAFAAGDMIVENFNQISRKDVQKKGKNDFVTWVDEKSESIIARILKKNFPSYLIMAEEGGSEGDDSDYLWVVDPLDGTTNFIQGIPHFAISIALLKDKKPIFGLIYQPIIKEIFYGCRGEGSFLNGQPIKVSSTEFAGEAFGATGFPFRTHSQLGTYMDTFKDLFKLTKGMRRIGAAALDLAYVACGRFDFFWEAYLQPWDFLAGLTIIEEAGGMVTDFTEKPLTITSSHVIAANPHLYKKCLPIIRKHFIT